MFRELHSDWPEPPLRRALLTHSASPSFFSYLCLFVGLCYFLLSRLRQNGMRQIEAVTSGPIVWPLGESQGAPDPTSFGFTFVGLPQEAHCPGDRGNRTFLSRLRVGGQLQRHLVSGWAHGRIPGHAVFLLWDRNVFWTRFKDPLLCVLCRVNEESVLWRAALFY